MLIITDSKIVLYLPQKSNIIRKINYKIFIVLVPKPEIFLWFVSFLSSLEKDLIALALQIIRHIGTKFFILYKKIFIPKKRYLKLCFNLSMQIIMIFLLFYHTKICSVF